jgi:hypothetical protein
MYLWRSSSPLHIKIIIISIIYPLLFILNFDYSSEPYYPRSYFYAGVYKYHCIFYSNMSCISFFYLVLLLISIFFLGHFIKKFMFSISFSNLSLWCIVFSNLFLIFFIFFHFVRFVFLFNLTLQSKSFSFPLIYFLFLISPLLF